MPVKVQAQTTGSPVAALVAFVRTVTTNKIRDALRSAGRRLRTVSFDEPAMGTQRSEDEAGNWSEFIFDPSAHLEIEEKVNNPLLIEIFEKYMATLSSQAASVMRFSLQEYCSGDHWTDEEVAEILDTSSDTVKSQRSRARKALHKYLRNQKDVDPQTKRLVLGRLKGNK